MRIAIIASLLLVATSAAGDTAREPSKKKRGLASAAAVVPGVLLHGSGHWVLGERKTARTLATWEGIGLGMAATGAVPLALTGAQRWLSAPGISLAVAGVGLFTLAWLADLYGVSGRDRAGARGRSRAALATAGFGYAFVHDPQFVHRSFAVAAGEISMGDFFVRPSLWLATGAATRRARTDVAYRLRGPTRRRPGRDASFIDLAIAGNWFDIGDERFSVLGLEARVDARYDLSRIGSTLRGSFASIAAGLGIERFSFDAGQSELNSQLLARFGFGIYLGQGAGALEIYYDHRRDDLVGGLATPNGVNGFLGSFGVLGRRVVTGPWSVEAEVAVGSAYMGRLALQRRLGGTR